MSDFVRVSLPDGAEATLSKAYVDSLDGALEVLDAPATNSRGVPLPATRKPVATEAPEQVEPQADHNQSESPASSDEAPTTTRRRVRQPEEATE